MAILRFDSEANLQTWLDSPQRQALPCESEPLVEEFHARIVRSGFDQWFPGSGGAAAGPPVWKQNMVVLLMLYPVVFLFGRYAQTPYLMGSAHIPFWAAALFIGNIASVVLLNWLVPWTSKRLDWWLSPHASRRRGIDLSGAALVVVLYFVCLSVFWSIS